MMHPVSYRHENTAMVTRAADLVEYGDTDRQAET